MKTHLLPLMTVSALAASAALIAAPDAGAGEVTMDPGPVWTSADGETEFRLRGRVFYDIADVDWDSPFSAGPSDDTEFRTARLGFQVENGPVKFVAEFDFSGDSVGANDVALTVSTGIGRIRVGHFKTTNSIDELTSSRHITFMERGLSTDLFHHSRRIGVAWYWSDGPFHLEAGVFGAPMDDDFNFGETDESNALTARAFWSDEVNGARIHAGGSWRRLNYDGGARVRVRPQAHLTNRFLGADYRAGAAMGEASRSDYYNVEFAAIRGPFHVQTEIARLDVDGPAGNPSFDSAFIEAGWWLTGESRGYKASSGTFDRTRPNRTLSEGGFGAWQIAARYDTADMADAGLGDYRTWTLGLNWGVEDHARVMLNFIDAEHDAPTFTETADIVQMRFQFDF